MDAREFYQGLLARDLGAEDGSGEVQTLCFCHDEQNPSCTINILTGAWYCFTMGKGGGPAQALALVKDVPLSDAVREVKGAGIAVAEKKEKPEPDPLDEQLLEPMERNLRKAKEQYDWIIKKWGLTPETIKEHRIGFIESTERISIPIYDERGRLMNIRCYDREGSGVNKMISYKEGYGTARLFPIKNLDAETLVIVEGEKDCILLNQHLRRFGPDGWKAITGTGGAGSWRDAWNESFKGKDVVIIYDRDEAGETNAKKIAARLVHMAREVKVVTLDISEPRGADVTNYFQDSSKTWDDLAKLIDDTDLFTPKTKVPLPDAPKDERVYRPHLSEASADFFVGKSLEMKVLVAGKELSPFAVPSLVQYDCNMDQGNKCDVCSVNGNHGNLELRIAQDDPQLVDMVRMEKPRLRQHLRHQAGVHPKCNAVREDILELQSVEEMTLVPEIDFSDQTKEYVSRLAYVSQHGVRPNASYVVKGTSVPHPRTQQVVHFIPDLAPAQDNIDDFEMDDKKGELLRIFQPAEGQSVADKFAEIANDLTLNITKIYGRDELIKAIDLCYHSVLAFNFQDKAVAKAWGDVLVVGDTRTGKTETIQAMIYHYKLGEMSQGENTSFAGLVGGLKQSANKAWQITWGRIPLNDRRLLVIDEVSGLSEETISNMSGIRSNGIAELTKIETQRTMARTRLIWLSNPRAARSLESYGNGVEAVKNLIGRPEDIARFDFALGCASKDVDISVINAKEHPEVEHTYTSDLCRLMVLWSWSRKASDVHFTQAATERILDLATEQSQRYASTGGIPLVEGGNHRIKLAKLAVAAACRLFSTDDGHRVIVRPEHAEFVADFLDESYANRYFDYKGWSETKLSQSQVKQELLDGAEDWVREHPEYAEVWLTNDYVRLDDFKTLFDLDTNPARAEIFAPLRKLNMISKGGAQGSFIRSPAFIHVLKKILRDEEELSKIAEKNGDDPDGDIPF